MTILITGATGFIGSHLASLLCARGEDVTCLIRKTSNLHWLEGLKVRYHRGAITDKESLRAAIRGKGIIFHLAGVTKALRPDDYYRVNAEGTRNLLEVCALENPGIKRFVLVSSLAAVGPSPSETPIDETFPPDPISDYGKSKLEAEKIAAEFMGKIPITIVRPPAVYGPRDRDIYFYFRMINRGWAFFVGGEDQLLSIVYAPNLAEAIVRLSESRKAIGETYFVCNPKSYGWSALSKGIADALGKKSVMHITVPLWLAGIVARFSEIGASITKNPPLLNRQKILEVRQPYWVCSAHKLRRDVGYVCPTEIDKGLAETAEWYRKNGWL